MVDFRKQLGQKKIERPTNPIRIYEQLDRASDKGPLRPAQRTILEDWFAHRRQDRDVILKLHTGGGKTVIGLVMLQSYMNEGGGPVVYLCPTDQLVQQTIDQAQEFGITVVSAASGALPAEFESGKAILVCTVQTMFNGLTRFGLGAQALSVGAICFDDAHACVDSIRSAFTITLGEHEEAYKELRDLFEADLREQGRGRYADIEQGEYSAFLPVPYWAWRDHVDTVTSILAKHKSANSIKFAWPLVRDILADCLCVVSGKQLQIAPYQPPLHFFGSFDRAPHRIFMSATVADDSFLVRGLGISAGTVNAPLRDPQERWSGEKMVLIPSLIDETLDDAEIVNAFASTVPKRSHGIVVLCPTFNHMKRWEVSGASVVKRDSSGRVEVDRHVERLRAGERSETVVFANRYDGIDLPDDTCRILILDSLPRPESLIDRYVASVREGSDAAAQRATRAIEQGLGRAVRGEKDYCVILLMGPDLVKLVRTPAGLRFLSAQTRLQIELGFDIAEMAKNEILDGRAPMHALRTLINQSLGRDEGWKAFYVDRMDALEEIGATPKNLAVYVAERQAEEQYRKQNIDGAVKTLQKLVNESSSPADQGWYLQEMARYLHAKSKTEANKTQIAAHAAHPLLLKPQQGMQVTKVSAASDAQVEQVLSWIRSHATYEELAVTVAGIVAQLRFGVAADEFEKALDDLGRALGFTTQRPDRQYKAGPDNLWAVAANSYVLFEAKSEVKSTRVEIHKSETGQMNNACGWFANEYAGVSAVRILIIPGRQLATGAAFNDDVRVMRVKHLNALTTNVTAFFGEFAGVTLTDITQAQVRERLAAHKLTPKDFASEVYAQELPTHP